MDREAFQQRVREEGELIREHLRDGTFDSEQVTVGLEYEFYAVDRSRKRLRRLPRDHLEYLGFEKELGLHNAELSSVVHPLNEHGATALQHEVAAKLRAIESYGSLEDVRLVSDGMWTIGPAGNTATGYLTEATRDGGITLAHNVSNAVRYHAFGSLDDDQHRIGGQIDVPGVTLETDTAGPVSLTTSIQPHYQCREARDLPSYFGIALRIAGPLLSLGVNSPFFPPDVYDESEPEPEVLLAESYAENRIPVYEQMMNPPDGPSKVRFPDDIDSATAAVDRIVRDRALVPAEISAGERFDDAFVHFRHQHGSFWRWVRPVFDGATEAAANARIEFRPLPGQPTIPDTVSFVSAFAGLLTGITVEDHPAMDLDWETARENFYAAARDGLDADLTWITADGTRTTDTGHLFTDLFDTAATGLHHHGFDRERARTWLQPLRKRVRLGLTPAGWKRRTVAAELEGGRDVEGAIEAMQRAYIAQQARTLADGHFTDWVDA